MAKHDKRIIAPSVLAADWSRLGEDCARAIKAGADWLHLDVMDGHFVDNISFGPKFIQTIHETTDIFLDVHLMISRPDRYLPQFIEAGADNLTVHIEADHDTAKTLAAIRDAGVGVGLALNPDTEFEKVRPFLDQIDLLLVMTVFPGFGGQSLIKSALETVAEASAARQKAGLEFHIQVDGGIDVESAPSATSQGANVLVSGTGLFKASDMAAAVSSMRTQ